MPFGSSRPTKLRPASCRGSTGINAQSVERAICSLSISPPSPEMKARLYRMLRQQSVFDQISVERRVPHQSGGWTIGRQIFARQLRYLTRLQGPNQMGRCDDDKLLLLS